jgi:hypothetical protein
VCIVDSFPHIKTGLGRVDGIYENIGLSFSIHMLLILSYSSLISEENSLTAQKIFLLINLIVSFYSEFKYKNDIYIFARNIIKNSTN